MVETIRNMMYDIMFPLGITFGRTRTAGVVVYQDDSVLLVEHTGKSRLPAGTMGFPAGRVERYDGDTIDTAIREAFEETGIRIERQHLYHLEKKYNKIMTKKGQRRFVFEPFMCDEFTGEPRSTDKTIPKWFRVEYLQNNSDKMLLTNPDVVEIAVKNFERYRLHKMRPKQCIDFEQDYTVF
jgi:8-oxo-dGTP pyrophosphatase MutT (NUDIX family)